MKRSFPACKHQNQKSKGRPHESVWAWLAAEPFRIFFLSGAVWSVVGVALWPLFFGKMLTVWPGMMHPRLMMQCFAGAFVVGFLGTAGPRMATAPRLSLWELLVLFSLHTTTGIAQLSLRPNLGDACFLGMLALLLCALTVRVVLFRKSSPPPQMILALLGLACGITGTILTLMQTAQTSEAIRFQNLLIYQGLLLPPVLGIGSFLFPRILGGEFGEPRNPSEVMAKLIRAAVAGLLLVASFFLEAWWEVKSAWLIRAAVCVAYLGWEIHWPRPGELAPRGSLAVGLYWALGLGLCGLLLTPFWYEHRIAMEHLLYIGTFGLLILVVASRVLFGHSGESDGFSEKSWMVRVLIFLAVLAATTRTSANFFPSILISHYIYAAWTWGLLAILWIFWHRKRFFRASKDLDT